MSVLVTGGAGYIGAHLVHALAARGDEPVVVDDLSSGIRERIAGVPLLVTDIGAPSAAEPLSEFMVEHGVESVIHMAARKQVPESVRRPAWYYAQNLGGVSSVLTAMESANVDTIVYSSSAAVYGEGIQGPISEAIEPAPINPYGATKLAGEWLIDAAAQAQNLAAASLRYFNVAGAGAPELGDVMALNLVPMVFERISAGQAPVIFGDDYDTPDGTCIRDFIHVSDLASAHLQVLDYLLTQERPMHVVLNVGTGEGHSVREVIDSIGRAMGVQVQPIMAPARQGDPARVVADSSLLQSLTDWRASHSLDDMTASAWQACEGRMGASSG